jgi:hypothetical protein
MSQPESRARCVGGRRQAYLQFDRIRGTVPSFLDGGPHRVLGGPVPAGLRPAAVHVLAKGAAKELAPTVAQRRWLDGGESSTERRVLGLLAQVQRGLLTTSESSRSIP